MPKTAVTGAAGFIGSAVVRRLLARGRQVRVILEPGADVKALEGLDVERVTCDVRDQAGMRQALEGCAALHHLAAVYKVWLADPSLLYSVNIDGTTATLLAARHAGVERIVYTSSLSTVGQGEGLSDERVPFNLWPIANDYIRSKVLSERIALEFARDGMPIVIALPGFPFGPRDRAPTPTGGIILSVLRGQVPAKGPGGFSAIDVDDCAEGHVLAEEKGRPGERYVLAAHNVELGDFIDTVCRVAGKTPPRVTLPGGALLAAAWAMEQWANRVSHTAPVATLQATQYMQQRVFFDTSKARHELGLPVRPLEDSVRRAVDYFTAERLI